MTLLSIVMAAALGVTAHPTPKVVLVKHADFIRQTSPAKGYFVRTVTIGKADLAAVRSRLAEHRLVTVVGPAGVGKTRLALSVVTEVAGRYADGAWYVDLVPVTDPAMVAHHAGQPRKPRSWPSRATRTWTRSRGQVTGRTRTCSSTTDRCR